MNPLLLVLNPRNITPCVQAIRALPIDQAWLTGYTERQLVPVIANLINTTPDYSHYLTISDDCEPTPQALTAVLHHLRNHPVVTGYCNLDETRPHVNISLAPPHNQPPTANDYAFPHETSLKNFPALIHTYLPGMCLTGMSRELWQTFPFDCYSTPGYASDYHLGHRLHTAGIPITAPKTAKVKHHKATWNTSDPTPGREILIGTIPPTITLHTKGGAA